MTVLFLLYIGFDVHGPSLHLLRTIVKDCLEKGHHVRMIARSRGGQDPVVPEEFITNSLFSYDIIEDSALEKSALAKRYCEDIRYAYRCKKIYEKYRDVDVVFLQSNTTPIFAIRLLKKTLSCPILFNVQNIFPIDALVLGKLKRKGIKGVAFYILRKMQQAAYRHSDCIITISEDMKHTLCQEGVSPEKIQVIYNWSYGDDPVNVPEEDNLFIKAHPEVKGKFRVVFAGNLGAMVDPYIIADSAEKLSEYKDIQFVIIGAGNNMKTLKELVEEKKLSNMLFYPYQPVEYAPHNYASILLQHYGRAYGLRIRILKEACTSSQKIQYILIHGMDVLH